MLHELELMRLPLYFKQLVGNGNTIMHSQPLQDMSKISVSHSDEDDVTAISNHVMRSDILYSGETDTPLRLLDFGVIRPIKDWDKKVLDSFDPICYRGEQRNHREQLLAENTEQWGNDLHCCIYYSHQARCYHASWSDEDKDEYDDWVGDDWEGMEPLNGIGNFKVGLLLDLNSGTLSVFKDGRMLGMMKDGLTGACCWYFCGCKVACTVKIKREMPPLTRND